MRDGSFSKKTIHRLFTRIAIFYDALNHFFSLGRDRLWRRLLVAEAGCPPESRVLDVCTGTVDLAIEFTRGNPSLTVTGVDMTEAMLKIGQDKIHKRGLGNRITLLKADAYDLPFQDGSFDVVGIAFGLRNLMDPRRGIAEMYRVLRDGGKLLVLEFAPPRKDLFGRLYHLYLKRIIPLVGGLLTGFPFAYWYLFSTIVSFMSEEQVVRLMAEAKLGCVKSRALTGGIVNIYSGRKGKTDNC